MSKGIHIKIDEIENGYIIELFSKDGPAELDVTKFYKTVDEVFTTILKWLKDLEAS